MLLTWCSYRPSVPTTIEPSTIDSSKIDSDTCPPSSQLSSIALSHPNRDAWPSWIQECVPELEKMMDSSAWKLVLSQWLELENALGYPSGKVCVCVLVKLNIELIRSTIRPRKTLSRIPTDLVRLGNGSSTAAAGTNNRSSRKATLRVLRLPGGSGGQSCNLPLGHQVTHCICRA